MKPIFCRLCTIYLVQCVKFHNEISDTPIIKVQNSLYLRKMSHKSKENEIMFGLYTYNLSVFIQANMAKPGDFTEKAYGILKNRKKRSMCCFKFHVKLEDNSMFWFFENGRGVSLYIFIRSLLVNIK